MMIYMSGGSAGNWIDTGKIFVFIAYGSGDVVVVAAPLSPWHGMSSGCRWRRYGG
jgi:hypothetical protein